MASADDVKSHLHTRRTAFNFVDDGHSPPTGIPNRPDLLQYWDKQMVIETLVQVRPTYSFDILHALWHWVHQCWEFFSVHNTRPEADTGHAVLPQLKGTVSSHPVHLQVFRPLRKYISMHASNTSNISHYMFPHVKAHIIVNNDHQSYWEFQWLTLWADQKLHNKKL